MITLDQTTEASATLPTRQICPLSDAESLRECDPHRRCGSAADVHASLLAGKADRCSRLMDWREAPGQKRMAISSADGSARSVRAIPD